MNTLNRFRYVINDLPLRFYSNWSSTTSKLMRVGTFDEKLDKFGDYLGYMFLTNGTFQNARL